MSPDAGRARLFRPDREAVFVERPNRFVLRARSGGEILDCHCPNPGRMLELLEPGTPLILEKRPSGGATEWTAAALRYRDCVVPLRSTAANDAAGALMLPGLFPGARGLKPEASVGSSRFDFRVEAADGTKHLIEVKACSLVERGLALFPDAPSLRASKHVEELASLADQGWACHVLFVVVHGTPERFSPNPHTDPAFAALLASKAGILDLRAARVSVAEDGWAVLAEENVPVDLSPGLLAAEDRGSYLIALELKERTEIDIGALGRLDLEPGWYVYSGSAQRGLASRTARHLRRSRKKKHWHLDYLTPEASAIEAYPIASYRNLECALARDLAALGGAPVPRFGSSDCGCPSHLHRFGAPPRRDRRFIDLLLSFRHEEAFLR